MIVINNKKIWIGSKAKTWVWIASSLLITASAVVSISIIAVRSSEVENLRQTIWRDGIDERLGRAFSAINDFPGSAGKDLLFLKTLSNEKDLRNFIRKNEAYDEIYVFGADGICTIRIQKNTEQGSGCGNVPSEVLSVAEKTKSLSADETYISPLSLYRGDPVLFYSAGNQAGDIYISVVNTNYFLEEIRRLSRSGETVYLLDSGGSYLADIDQSKEIFNGSHDTFYQDFVEIPAYALSDSNTRRFETDRTVFTFWRIYPTESNFALYEGSNRIFGSGRDSQYFWVMAAVSQKPEAKIWWQNSSSMASGLAVLLAHIAVIALLYFVLAHHESSS